MAVSDELMTTIALRLEATVREMLSRAPEAGSFDDAPRPFGGAPLSHRPSSRDVPMLLMKSAPLSCLYEYRGDYKRNVQAQVEVAEKIPWQGRTSHAKRMKYVAVPHISRFLRRNRGSAAHLMHLAPKPWQCHASRVNRTGTVAVPRISRLLRRKCGSAAFLARRCAVKTKKPLKTAAHQMHWWR